VARRVPTRAEQRTGQEPLISRRETMPNLQIDPTIGHQGPVVEQDLVRIRLTPNRQIWPNPGESEWTT